MVIYIDVRMRIGGDMFEDIVEAVDAGYTVVNLAFWMNAGPADAAMVWTRDMDAAKKQRCLDYAHARGAKIMVSAGGATEHLDTLMGQGVAGDDYGRRAAQWAVEHGLDGVDFDLELTPGNHAPFRDGSGTDWIVACNAAARAVLGSARAISHAPQAPYFGAWAGEDASNRGAACPAGSGKLCGYAEVYRRAPDIDFLNVQYYNQGNCYDTRERIFSTAPTSHSLWHCKNTAAREIAALGVPLSKLNVGKPLIPAEAANGHVAWARLEGYLREEEFVGGVMVWQWRPDVSEPAIAAIREELGKHRPCGPAPPPGPAPPAPAPTATPPPAPTATPTPNPTIAPTGAPAPPTAAPQCFIAACGCPGSFREPWCSDENQMPGWCAQTQSNCEGCSGEWCPGSAPSTPAPTIAPTDPPTPPPTEPPALPTPAPTSPPTVPPTLPPTSAPAPPPSARAGHLCASAAREVQGCLTLENGVLAHTGPTKAHRGGCGQATFDFGTTGKMWVKVHAPTSSADSVFVDPDGSRSYEDFQIWWMRGGGTREGEFLWTRGGNRGNGGPFVSTVNSVVIHGRERGTQISEVYVGDEVPRDDWTCSPTATPSPPPTPPPPPPPEPCASSSPPFLWRGGCFVLARGAAGAPQCTHTGETERCVRSWGAWITEAECECARTGHESQECAFHGMRCLSKVPAQISDQFCANVRCDPVYAEFCEWQVQRDAGDADGDFHLHSTRTAHAIAAPPPQPSARAGQRSSSVHDATAAHASEHARRAPLHPRASPLVSRYLLSFLLSLSLLLALAGVAAYVGIGKHRVAAGVGGGVGGGAGKVVFDGGVEMVALEPSSASVV